MAILELLTAVLEQQANMAPILLWSATAYKRTTNKHTHG